MIVLDASAGIEWLLGRPVGRNVAGRLTEPDQSVHIPHLWLVEVLQGLRRLTADGIVDAERAQLAVTDATDLAAHRYDHEPFAPRIWQLRHNFTAHDAVYVALAEALEVPLLTTDARLRNASGSFATIELMI